MDVFSYQPVRVMLLRATKDDHEREEDEAERLVRPAPKVKPPRKDRRRETIQSELDPDTSGDPDLKGGKDLSLNYKTIGGSTLSVLARFLDARGQYVPVIDKEDNETKSILESTAKANPHRYRIQKQEPAEEPVEAPEVAPSKAPAPSDSAVDPEVVNQLQALEKSDPAAKAFFDSARSGQVAFLAKENPALVIPPRPFQLPVQIKTFGDLARYLKEKPAAPARAKGKPNDLVPKAKPDKGKAPEAKADGKDKPAPEKSSEQRVVERFKQEKLQSPDFNEYVRGLPTTDEDAEGNALFLDKSTKPKKHVPFDELPLQAQKEVIAQFDGVQKNQARTKAIQELASSDPKLRALLAEVATLKGKSLVEPEVGSTLERLMDLQAQGFPLDELPIKKHLPELSGVTLPEEIATVADLVQAAQAVVPAAPKRPAVSKEEAARIRDLLRWGLGSDRAAQLSSLHPKDQENIISQWAALRRKGDPSKDKQFFKDLEVIRGGVDITSIEPPKKVAWKGKEVDYDRLSSQDKAEALQAYRNRLTAVKLVGQDLYKDMLADRVPAPLVSVLTPEGKKTPPVQVFKGVLTDGVEEPPLPAKKLKRLFKDLSPDSWPTVAAYFQARDLQDAHKRYLQTNAINEQLPARDIVRQLQSATDDLRERDRLYPEGMSLNTAADFRRLTLQHLESLARQGSMPVDNYRNVRRWCQTVDADDYDSALAKWKSRGEEVSKSGGLDQLPLQPEKPEGYDEIRGVTPRPSGLWSKLKNFMAPARPQSRVASRYLSTCTDVRLMSASTRTAVYWGVAPYPTDHEGFAPYNEWEQLHARAWSEKDAETLLDAAKEWLKSDLLSLAMGGSDPDVAYRAALDLAIRVTDDGKYSGGLHPRIYNELLAKLAGDPVGETLLTIREASTFPYNLGGGNMKTSAQLCRIATTLAESNSFPDLAFDLIHLSHKVAQQEQEQEQEQDDMQDASQADPADLDQGQQKQAYIALRRAVIHTAKNNPQVRQAFLPVLKLIQQLG